MIARVSAAWASPMRALLHALDGAAAPLDAARRWLLRGAGHALGPARLAVWSRERELRVAALGALGVAGALALAVLAPGWTLALGPLLLGVPHLVADVRYLVARPGLHRAPAFWVAVALPVALAGVTGRSAFAGLALAGAGLAAGGHGLRRAACAGLGAAWALAAWRAGPLADLAFAHAHNAVAFVVLLAWGGGSLRARALPLGLFVAASTALVLGAFDGPATRALAGGPAGLPFEQHLDALAPTWAAPEFPIALRLVLLFAFAQSVHYGVWLRLLPEVARPRAAPRSFAMSLRALRRDVGAVALGAAAALALGLLARAAIDVGAARELYLRVAAFHGSLEIGVLGWAAARGVRLGALGVGPQG